MIIIQFFVGELRTFGQATYATPAATRRRSCRSEILHARIYNVDLSKGIARAEIFFEGFGKIGSEAMVVEHWWPTLAFLLLLLTPSEFNTL